MHKEPLPGSSTHEPLPSFCCQKDCIQKLDAALLAEWNDMKAKLGNDEVNEFVYTLLKTMPQKRSWQLLLSRRATMQDRIRSSFGDRYIPVDQADGAPAGRPCTSSPRFETLVCQGGARHCSIRNDVAMGLRRPCGDL